MNQNWEKILKSSVGIKWYFRNDISENYSEKPGFTPKSKWKPPKGHSRLEVFLNQIEKELGFLNLLSTLLITLTFPRRNGNPWGH